MPNLILNEKPANELLYSKKILLETAAQFTDYSEYRILLEFIHLVEQNRLLKIKVKEGEERIINGLNHCISTLTTRIKFLETELEEARNPKRGRPKKKGVIINE